MTVSRSVHATGAPEETIELSCGCKIRAASRTSGRRPLVKCEEASRLWDEVRSARDDRLSSLRSTPEKGRRRGARTREGREVRDRFEGLLADYYAHLGFDESRVGAA